MPRNRNVKRTVKRRVTKGKGRRKLQSKVNDIANAAMALGATATYHAAKRYFGTQYSAYDKPYGNTTRVTGSKQVRIKGPREKFSEGQGGYAQWTQRYATARFGKLTPKKIDKLSNDVIIFRHQLIGPFNDYGQAFMYNATNASGNLYYPLMLFELNSINNVMAGTTNQMHCVHRMYQPAATTNIAWQSMTGQGPSGGVAGNALTVEKTPLNGLTAVEQSIHKWSSLDLELWGQTAKPTVFSIYLCQLSEDVLPTTTYTSGVGSYDTITDQSACEFWQAMVKRYVYSPLSKIDDGYGNKKIKILKQYKVNLDPTSTTESDPDPHVKTMKLFYRFNRQCKFEWKYSNPTPFSISNMNDSDWQQEVAQTQCQVHPNARLFVMVRASNYQKQTLDTNANNTNSPSISWLLRSCHLINQ